MGVEVETEDVVLEVGVVGVDVWSLGPLGWGMVQFGLG